MDIGMKLKNARQKAELTQEQAAESLNVSRQTISNWENNRSYPDIVSVIQISSLYGVSLDELLKEDENMIAYLKESTDRVKSRQKFSRRILIAACLVIWSMLLIRFWLGGAAGPNAMGYSLIAFYLILPVATLVISVFIGRDEEWRGIRWLMVLFFGGMYMMIDWGTFALANMLFNEDAVFHLPEISDLLPGMLCSAAGIAVGTLIRKWKEKKETEKKK